MQTFINFFKLFTNSWNTYVNLNKRCIENVPEIYYVSVIFSNIIITRNYNIWKTLWIKCTGPAISRRAIFCYTVKQVSCRYGINEVWSNISFTDGQFYFNGDLNTRKSRRIAPPLPYLLYQIVYLEAYPQALFLPAPKKRCIQEPACLIWTVYPHCVSVDGFLAFLMYVLIYGSKHASLIITRLLTKCSGNRWNRHCNFLATFVIFLECMKYALSSMYFVKILSSCQPMLSS